MELILLKDVKGQGKKGDIIKVSDGYAANFLLPKGLAELATKSSLNAITGKKDAMAHRQDLEKAKAVETSKRIKEITLEIKTKAGAGGKLFGSITSKDISEILKEKYNVDVDKKKIALKDAIKSIGSNTVDIKLYPGVSAKLSVKVVEDDK